MDRIRNDRDADTAITLSRPCSSAAGAQMRSGLVPTVVTCAAVAVAAVGSFFAFQAYASIYSANRTVRIAAVPVSGDGHNALTALQREIVSDRAPIQLSVVDTPSVWASARALREEKADVAVVRSDDAVAVEGRTVFVLKSVQLALLVPAQASTDGISRLKGRKIGVIADDALIDPMAKAVLDFYGFDEKQIVTLDIEELAAALRNKRVAAVAVVGPNGTGPIARTVEIFRTVTRKPPRFLDLSEARALADRLPVYQESEIPAGSFGGGPTVPAGDVRTLSTRVLLVARSSVSNAVAGDLTRLLLAAKTRLAATSPEAGQLAPPPTDKEAIPPAHPGTIAFLNDEQPDLLDRSTNVFLLTSIVTGFVGSLAAGLNALRNMRRGQELKGRIRRLLMLLAQANGSLSGQLGAIEKEVSQLSELILQKFMANEISSRDFHGAEATLTHLGALIRKKRRSASFDDLEQFYGQWQAVNAGAGPR
jgi:TRAP transporter TAXI family solute receptor